jgi:itaconate CoA-transferase
LTSDLPLSGLLVVALEQAVAAPTCSVRLADAGARVIKIERAEGDFARGYDRDVMGESAYFVWLNRGKESVVLDVKAPEDRALLARLIARADVFIQNLAPGAAGRLGFDSAALRARHPALVTVDISGFGESGPYAGRKAYDLLIQAESGLAEVTGRPEGPGRVGVSVCDIATGLYAYQGVLEALIRRGRTGQGAGIQVSLFDAMAEWMNVPFLQTVYGGKAPKRDGLAHPTIAPYGLFPAADGEILISIQNEREWVVFCERVLGDAALASDARFANNTARVANREALDAQVSRAFGAQPVETLAALLDDAKIAYGRVSDMLGLIAHRSLATAEVETPGGNVIVVAPPVIIDGARPKLGRVPKLGEHTDMVRREFGSGHVAQHKGAAE